MFNSKGTGFNDSMNAIGQGLHVNKLTSTNQKLRESLGMQDLTLAMEKSKDSYEDTAGKHKEGLETKQSTRAAQAASVDPLLKVQSKTFKEASEVDKRVSKLEQRVHGLQEWVDSCDFINKQYNTELLSKDFKFRKQTVAQGERGMGTEPREGEQFDSQNLSEMRDQFKRFERRLQDVEELCTIHRNDFFNSVNDVDRACTQRIETMKKFLLEQIE